MGRPIMRHKDHGFTLIEMMIALVIMALIGLMAWRGLDGLIRGKERIDAHNLQQRDLQYALTLLDRDCRSMLSEEHVGMAAVALGSQSIWWMRTSSQSGQPSWQLVGYRTQNDGLYRLSSSPFPTRDKALETWRSVLSAPENGFAQIDSQHLTSEITRQQVTVLSDLPNKASPVRGLKFIWQLASNQPGNNRSMSRICQSVGF